MKGNDLFALLNELRVNGRSEPLELPVRRDGDVRPPQLTPSEYMAWCEDYMKLNPSGFARRLEEGPRVRPDFSL